MTEMLDPFLRSERIAYFSMEVALQAEIPTYSGGLGVLAGDTVRTAADLELPLVTVTLASRMGYFRQGFTESGEQTESPDPWEPSRYASRLNAKVAVVIGGRDVWIAAWLYVHGAHTGGRQPVILLDTDLDENEPQNRALTHHLYGGDQRYRLAQEIVLGIGGVRMLRALGFRIRHYHMNEGHSALLALELLRESAYPAEDVRSGESPYDVPRVRELCNFTTHTPIEAGHDRFDYDLVRELLGDYFDIALLRRLAGDEALNMTRLALNLSEYVNGVAKRHAEVSARMFPGYQVRAVTNGVHPFTWTSAPIARLYDRHIPGWCHEPALLVRADCCLPAEALWAAHGEAKRALIDLVRERCGLVLDAHRPTLGYARRITGYKRPDLLFSDLARLRAIGARYPFQIVVAGKAHPKDEPGRRLVAAMHRYARELAGAIPMAFIPDYDLRVAQQIVAGVDVWLNTPLPPLEASGTSGMKAAFNGVPSLSVLDGWWIEGCIEGVTGWAIGEADGGSEQDAQSLYDKLENAILPLYYSSTGDWMRVMQGAIAKNASYFNSHRMLRRYATDAYLR